MNRVTEWIGKKKGHVPPEVEIRLRRFRPRDWHGWTRLLRQFERPLVRRGVITPDEVQAMRLVLLRPEQASMAGRYVTLCTLMNLIRSWEGRLTHREAGDEPWDFYAMDERFVFDEILEDHIQPGYYQEATDEGWRKSLSRIRKQYP